MYPGSSSFFFLVTDGAADEQNTKRDALPRRGGEGGRGADWRRRSPVVCMTTWRRFDTAIEGRAVVEEDTA